VTAPKLLYVGPDYPGSNGTCFRDAFLRLSLNVATLDCEKLMSAPQSSYRKAISFLSRQPGTALVNRLNEQIILQSEAFRPDIVFFIQARYVKAETIRELNQRSATFVYMNDDMFNPANQTRTFHQAIREFQYVFTTKTYNVEEFKAAGAGRVAYFPNAYDPVIHYPAVPTAEELRWYYGDIGFIGTFRRERADFLAEVANDLQQHTLNVWGGGWHKMSRPYFPRARWVSLRRRVRGAELWCADMGKAIQSNKIMLGLLNRANRDRHTSRSVEIPACGGFMLAERTDEHRTLFEEDKEAVYFDSYEELKDKVNYYLRHEEARLQIARAGYERCVKSQYTYKDRARFVLDQYAPMTRNRRSG
jgi:spore maturation protein CgeB